MNPATLNNKINIPSNKKKPIPLWPDAGCGKYMKHTQPAPITPINIPMATDENHAKRARRMIAAAVAKQRTAGPPIMASATKPSRIETAGSVFLR